jgi:hypothetical protein
MHMLQLLLEIIPQWVNPDSLDRTIYLVGKIVFASAGCLAKVVPVGGMVAGSRKSLGINECFKQMNVVMVLPLPISTYPVGNSGEYMRGKTLHLNPGKNQETGIVGNLVYIYSACLGVPSNKAIAAADVSGGRTEGTTGDRSIVAENNILEMFADRLRVTQIVVLRDESVMELFVLGAPNRNYLKGL